MIAFFCRTPMHILRTIQLKYELFSREICDVYLFDTFPKADAISKRMADTELFSDVLFFHDKDYLKSGKARELRTALEPSDFKKKLKSKIYNEIYLFNIYGAFNELIYNVLRKNNTELVVNMVEDGPSIYHIESYDRGFVRRYLYDLVGLKSYLENINCWWFSRPELMEALYGGKKKKLPEIHKENVKMVATINNVFDYDYNEDIANADFLIMEECYWNDGLLPQNDDFMLYEQLKEFFKGKKIVVKLHPRTKHNRFEGRFTTINANGIPWEVYALNMEMNKKILVSLSCATMVSSKLLYGEETYSLLLYPIIEDKILSLNSNEKYLTKDRKKKIDSQIQLYEDKTKFVKAESIEQAKNVLTNWLQRINN